MNNKEATRIGIEFGKKNYKHYLECLGTEDSELAFKNFIFLIGGILVKHIDSEDAAKKMINELMESALYSFAAGEPV